MTKKLTGTFLALTAAIAMMLGACSTESDSHVIDDFIRDVNANTASTGVRAAIVGDTVLITYLIKNTPENRARIMVMMHDEPSIEIFEKKITESLNEGEILARMVKERKTLSFRIAAGKTSFTLRNSPQIIKEVAFPDQK